MVYLVKVPRLNANEDEIIVTSVGVSEGDWVDVGQELFEIESTKASVSVEAESAGYVRCILAKIDNMMGVGGTLCVLADTQEEPLPDIDGTRTGAGTGEQATPAGTPANLTAKERLQARRGASGTVGSQTAPDRPSQDARVPVIPSEELEWVQEARSTLAALSGGPDMQTYDSLPLSENVDNHQNNGVYIGPGARMGAGSQIMARSLYMGPGAQIGSYCRIEADSVYIGACAKIGGHGDIVTGELILEDGAAVAEHVTVDLAGGRSEESRLLVGGGSLISSKVLINTCREVVLDRESALSPGVMVFTHSFWQSVLERYSVIFQGVRLCENAWVGAGCQVLPGVSIGPGSVVMSNSTVVEDVPSYSLVGGVPATLIRSNMRRVLASAEQVKILLQVLGDFISSIETKGCKVEGTPDAGMFRITLPDGNSRQMMLLAPGQIPPPEMLPDGIMITMGQAVSISDGASVLDVADLTFAGVEDRLTHELRNFLRRHGIRFTPYAWDSSFAKGL